MKKNKVDQLFSKFLVKHEATPTKASWEAMEAMLNKAEKKEKRPVWWYWSAAAVLLLSIGFWFGQGFNPQQTQNTLAVVEPEKDSSAIETAPKAEQPKTEENALEADENALKQLEKPVQKKPSRPKKVRVSGYYAQEEPKQNNAEDPNESIEKEPEQQPEIAQLAQPEVMETLPAKMDITPAEAVDNLIAQIEFRPAQATEELAEVSFKPRQSSGKRLLQKVKAIRNGDASIKDLGLNRQNLISLVTNRNEEE